MPLVTQRVEFECCYVEPPNHLNAHRYRWEVTVQGPQKDDDSGKVIEFSSLQSLMKNIVPDNMFLYNSTPSRTDDEGPKIAKDLDNYNIPICNICADVSAENILIYLVACLQSDFLKDSGMIIKHSKLQETSHSWVDWDNPQFGIDMNNGSLYRI